MNIKQLVAAAQEVISVLEEYHAAPDREMLIDPVLYAYLRAKHTSVTRQHYVYRYGSNRPKRIDFRSGGNNPTVLEFAVRPPTGGAHLHGPSNTSELRKLCRVSTTAARLRALLLMDLYHRPVSPQSLKQSYEGVGAGPGNFKRHSVRVIYVHRQETFNFLWRP